MRCPRKRSLFLTNTPPHNDEAERSVIGAILLDPSVFNDVEHLLTPQAFYSAFLGKVWGKCASLKESGVQADLVALSSILPDNAFELSGLMNEVVGTSQIEAHARIVAEMYARRQAIDSLRESVEALYSGVPLHEIHPRTDFGETESDYIGVDIVSRDAVEHVAELYDGNVKPGITTGYPSIDDLGCRLFPGELITLAARPRVGKTTLGLNIAQNVSVNEPVGFVSMEMTRQQLVTRMAYRKGNLSSSLYRTGRMDKKMFLDLTTALQSLNNLNLWIDDSRQTIKSLVVRARRQQREKGLRVLVVDYLQLLTGTRRGTMSRAEQVGDYTRELKILAKELDITVILLSQINREGADKPSMENLKETGSTEENSDQVWILYRPEIEDQPGILSDEALLAVPKNREGESGRVDLTFFGQFFMFTERY